MSKPTLLTGVKPTGDIHIANYYGAIKPAVDLLNTGMYESFVFVADYHALNFVQNAGQMRQLSIDLVKTYMACGLNPNEVALFKQSEISEHTELAWIFDTITTMPYLMRAHAFKDAEAKGTEVTVGTFNYPMLMAADILLYDSDIVPVGQDQKQHIEYARDTAEKFNRTFGKTFKLPKDHIMPDVAVVPGIDGRKMSKSYGNTIPLFVSRDELAKSVMSIVTDSSGERPENVYAIHKLVKSEAELEPVYKEHAGKYKALKDALVEDLDAFLAPMREKYESISDDEVSRVLAAGTEKARARASTKMEIVRKAIGIR